MSAQTQYVRHGDVNIAYQVSGEGPVDLVLVPGFISHLDMDWTEPGHARFLRGLSAFTRLIRFDRPGCGLSDPVPGVPTLEERMEQLHTVMEAAGSKRTYILGHSEGGAVSALFAATYPELTAGLIIYGSFATGKDMSDDAMRRIYDMIDHRWGQGDTMDLFAPSFAKDKLFRIGWSTFERTSASPGMARALWDAACTYDVSAALPQVRVPTLVLHRKGDFIPIEAGRKCANLIPGARMVELEGDDHIPGAGDTAAIVAEIEEFMTGERSEQGGDRILATILFCDIVGSTELAARVGDARWGEMLQAFYAEMRQQIQKQRGREVDTAGDGFFVAFDGPGRAVSCARAMIEATASLDLPIRVALHAGECEVIGEKIGGIAVHTAARIMNFADAGQIVVSSTVRDLVAGSDLNFAPHKQVDLKGVPGRWQLYLVSDAVAAPASPIMDTRRDKAFDRMAISLARTMPWLSRMLIQSWRRSTAWLWR